MIVSFNTSQFDLEKIRKIVEKKIIDVRNKTTIRVFNTIATMSDYPYWSGSYMASWNISIGSPDTSYVPLPKRTDGQPDIRYARPQARIKPLSDLDTSNPYQIAYVTNAVPHAYKVEFEGTPRHSDPWMIAHHAVSSIATSLRFF